MFNPIYVQDSNNKPRDRFDGNKKGNWKSELLYGTWNVRSLYKPRATLDLVTKVEKNKIKCVALQEIRWEDTGTTKVSQTTIFNGKCEHPHKLEIGFTIHESIIHTVKVFRIISPRI